ncbi:MG2 domain-containing protein, partial [Fusobacterium sp.]|uniref:alpha-2-macroglobulin family protein n=1 Tax=Fusobacterium sp. TaxID=68766 RepID=UPI00260C8452
MKKLLCLIFLFMMLGCNKENEEENKKITENTSIKMEEINEGKKISKEIKQIKELGVVGVTTNSENNPKIEIEFTEKLKDENIDGFINISPNVNYKILKDRSRLIIVGDFKIGETYNLEILKGIKDIKGSILKENIKKVINFNEKEPKLVFSNDGIILPSSNDKKIAFKSINVKKVNVKIKKIYENNFTQFLQEFIFKGNGNVFDYGVDENFYKVGDTVFNKDYELNIEKNVWQQNEIDLDNFVDKKGLFLVEVTFDEKGIDYTFPKDKDRWERQNLIDRNGKIGKAILLSNIGVIAQKEKENTNIIAMDILKNSPIKDATVKLISFNNQVTQEGKTDENGEVKFRNNKDIMYALIESEDEKSILKFNDSKLSYDGFEVDGSFNIGEIKSFIYTDRGVYRPGDTINVSMIVRNIKEKFPDNHPVKINVYNPVGKRVIENQIIKDGKDGFYKYSFNTDLESETGIWKIELEVGSEKFIKDISIETIVPYKIKVETKLPEKIDLNDENSLNMDIKSKYLFGADADNLKYNVELNIKEKNINFEKYRNYTFKNPISYGYSYGDYTDGVLNEVGEGKVNFNIEKVSPKDINLVGILTTKVIEKGGRPVIKRDIINLNKFETYVGIEIPEDRYIKAGDKINLKVVTVSEDGKDIVPNRRLKYRVYKNEYSWWWDYNNYDTFIKSIKTDKNTVLLYEKEFISEDKPTILDYEIAEEGEVFVEVEDIETRQSTGVNLYASTWQDSSINKKIDKLKMETDKKKYGIGDEARVTFEGTEGAKALITIEKSGRILDKKWVNLKGIKNIYEFKVTEEMFPNAYININLFQDYNKLNNDRPLRLYGAVPIFVENPATELKIDLDTPREIKPNESFKIKVENKDKKKIQYTVAVVDEGILNITNFETPNPWKYFYEKEGLQISYFDNYSEIMGKTFGKINKILKTGGDDFLESEMVLNSAKRKENMGIENVQRFKPVALFKGILETDEEGRGEVEFTMPNYLGAVKVMVVGVDENKYGVAESEILVKSPLVTEMTLPRNLKVGDSFEIPVTIFALEENIGNVKVKLDIFGEEKVEKLTLNKKENKKVVFKGKVPNEIGDTKIKIEVLSKKFDYKDSVDININSDSPYLYKEEIKILEKNKKISFKQPKEFIKGSVKSYITISNTPQLSLDKRINWLIRYPYGCVEQTTSTVFPQLYLEKLTNIKNFNREEVLKNINGGIDRLEKFQLYDGSFSYWIGGESDIWATNYVGNFLIEAKNLGYYVPNEIYNRWIEFTKGIVRNSNINLNTRVYGIYLLALADNPEVSQMNLIYENYFKDIDNISRWLLASSYKLIGEERLAQKIAKKLDFSLDKDEEYRIYSYGSDLRDKSIILGAYYNIFEKIEENLYKDILEELQLDEWLSTQTLGYSLMTFAKISPERKNEKISGEIILDGEKIKFNEDGEYQKEIGEDIKNIKIISKNQNNL